mmetsp:Transcript_3412/g.7815  ORF Transcript_3412/g.7815 Transcript_3412/m.7815 type:complete len:294 (+) Transcript_3412:1179-2060(+)
MDLPAHSNDTLIVRLLKERQGRHVQRSSNVLDFRYVAIADHFRSVLVGHEIRCRSGICRSRRTVLVIHHQQSQQGQTQQNDHGPSSASERGENLAEFLCEATPRRTISAIGEGNQIYGIIARLEEGRYGSSFVRDGICRHAQVDITQTSRVHAVIEAAGTKEALTAVAQPRRRRRNVECKSTPKGGVVHEFHNRTAPHVVNGEAPVDVGSALPPARIAIVGYSERIAAQTFNSLRRRPIIHEAARRVRVVPMAVVERRSVEQVAFVGIDVAEAAAAPLLLIAVAGSGDGRLAI